MQLKKAERISYNGNIGNLRQYRIILVRRLRSQNFRHSELEAAGIHQNTIRLSIGTEHIDDIIADLEKGFAAVK